MIGPLALAAACAVTVPNGLTPPGPQEHDRGHGARGVWTTIPSGRFDAEPYWTKLFWWSTRSGQLTVSGRRLDAPGRLVVHKVIRGTSEGFRGRGTWASRVTFPTAGCWRVTGRVGKTRLSYVVEVRT